VGKSRNPGGAKARLLDAIVAREGISQAVRNLVAVLIDHQRMHFLEPIIRQLGKELDQRLGLPRRRLPARATLGERPAKRKSRIASRKADGQEGSCARYARSESLLGGAVVRVGSTIYDGSVKGQLESIKDAISS
jgi:F-type H+-transporting ATPase subunit delta